MGPEKVGPSPPTLRYDSERAASLQAALRSLAPEPNDDLATLRLLARFTATEQGRFGAVSAILPRLAFLHQQAAISRATHVAGWKAPPTTEEVLRAATYQPRWLRSYRWDHQQQQRVEGDSRLADSKGLHAADRLRPILAALEELLSALDDAVPMSVLAAMPEPQLADRAATAAQAVRDRQAGIAAARRAHGEPPVELSPQERRDMCPRWHRRRLRREAGHARQHLAAMLGTVGAGTKPYADDYSLARWQERQHQQQAWAAAHTMQSADGRSVPMLDLVSASQRAQLSRLYAQSLGLDALAQRAGLIPIFITMTLPGEWHPNPGNRRRDSRAREWTPEHSPLRADAELKARWAKLRSMTAKAGVRMLGLRVREPHRDGCPHLHALLYVREDEIAAVDRALNSQCPEPEGARERVASKLVVIDRECASPASYVMKYILKAVSRPPTADQRGRAEGDDEDQDDQLAHYERHRATASERGWRRYAWLGLHGSQRVWQRLLGLAPPADKQAAGAETRSPSDRERVPLPADASPRMQAAHDALHDGRWADALEALGAIRPARPEPGAERALHHRLRLTYTSTREDGAPMLTAYGDPARRPDRIEDTETGWSLPLRGAAWRIATLSPNKEAAEKHQRTKAAEYERDMQRIDSILAETAEAMGGGKGVEAKVTVVDSCPRAGAAPPPAPADQPRASGKDGQMVIFLTSQPPILETESFPPRIRRQTNPLAQGFNSKSSIIMRNLQKRAIEIASEEEDVRECA